ncbi:hypothetical protein [Burkholderia perseverans]|uniref:hypothetical protein n=1 Tax=Burkholderia perseverans TaxID=2615214 RepID=UPI001FF0639D|nr:hypothetical protein [Burkholderia perseverans]
MQRKREGRVWRAGAVAAMTAFVALGLAACGGGDDDTPAPAPAAGGGGGGKTPADTGITVDGTSKTVAADNKGNVSVMAPPMPNNKYGEISETGLSMATLAASALTEAAPGAYTGFDADHGFKLTKGAVTDLAGNGQYAIGRWTDGTDSSGATYTRNQGRMWAIGTPLHVTLTPDTPLDCQLEAATRPVDINGNTAPGKLDTATVKAQVTEATPGDLKLAVDINLGYSIGQDTQQSFKIHADNLNGVGYMSNRADSYTVVTRLVGTDKNAPYWLLSYTFNAPTTGAISGVAALACTMPAVQTPDKSDTADKSDKADTADAAASA